MPAPVPSKRRDDLASAHERAADPGRGATNGPETAPVSVIMPARDADATIEKALRSVLAQDYAGAVELIVADGSDDPATSETVRRVAPAARIVPNPTGATPAGLNLALRASTSPIVVRCDAHAALPEGYLRRAVATLRRTGAANVGGRQAPEGTSFFTRAVALAQTTRLGTGNARYRQGGVEGPVDTVYLGVFRRDAFDRVGGFNEAIPTNEDYELNWRLRAAGETVWFDPALAVDYRPRRTLRALARQYFLYGRGKRMVLRRHPRSWRLRHFAAPLLVIGLIFDLALAAAAGTAPALLLTWLGALIVGSPAVGLSRREPAALLLPLVLAAMHLSWGLGFLLPQCRFRPWLLSLLLNKRRTAAWRVRWRIRSRELRAERARRGPARHPPAVLTFDARIHNPIRWRRDAEPEVAALGPRALLPPGAHADRVLPAHRVRRLRRMHHLEDVSAFHADADARARVLVRLAAGGVVVHLADRDPKLRALLGDDLHRLMTTDAAGLDVEARELLGIAMRRAALRDHAAGNRPLVSILLATRRPTLLPQALDAVTRQTYPKLELVLALHGIAAPELERRLADCPCPVRVVRTPAADPLGAVLNAAASAATGTLVAKMDDDDFYGDDHVWDLVLAHEYSQASLVGKGIEFVYLAESNRTIRFRSGRGEDYRTWPLAGGALSVSRRMLDRAGGWRPVAIGSDSALVKDVLRAGGSAYRTHGAGFMLMRRGRGRGHTWDVSDNYWLATADRVSPGWNPALAGIGDLPRPAGGAPHASGCDTRYSRSASAAHRWPAALQ